MGRIHNNSGLTLLELLISIAILGIIVIGLHQALGSAISAYDGTKEKQDLMAQARYAMERMVMFVQETDHIQVPAADQLIVYDRVLDTHDNTTVPRDYLPAGDGYLDSDHDADGLINEGGGDLSEPITFDLDKDDGSNWKLQERLPDYRSQGVGDHLAQTVLCEHVTDFQLKLLAANQVLIRLTLNDGKSEVSLITCVKAMHAN